MQQRSFTSSVVRDDVSAALDIGGAEERLELPSLANGGRRASDERLVVGGGAGLGGDAAAARVVARLDSLEGSVGSVQAQMQRTADMVEKVLDAILHQDS